MEYYEAAQVTDQDVLLDHVAAADGQRDGDAEGDALATCVRRGCSAKKLFGTFRKLGGTFFGVLITRILLFRVLY